MTTHDDLLQAVLNHPDDDGPRLIYADWLDEHGDPARAEFIRVQIERHAVFGDRTPLNEPHYLHLAAREKTLFALNHERWIAPLRQKGEPFQSRDSHGVYQRGFIHEVWMRARTFISRSRKLFERVPVRILKLIQVNSLEWKEFVALTILEKLHTIDLRSIVLSDEMFERFAVATPMTSVREIILDAGIFIRNERWRFLDREIDWSKTELVLDSTASGIRGSVRELLTTAEFQRAVSSRYHKVRVMDRIDPSIDWPES